MRKRKKAEPISAADEAFFQNFYETYKGFIAHSARKNTPSGLDYEDVVQDVILRLLENIKTIKEVPPPQIYKYMSLTVRAAITDRLRKRPNELLSLSAVEDLSEMACEEVHAVDQLSTYLAIAETNRLRKKLPDRDWKMLEGKYIMGYSQEELASLIGVAPDSIRMLLVRARKKAKNILEEKGENVLQ